MSRQLNVLYLNWPQAKVVLMATILAAMSTSCGVRGKPSPPATPPGLGRGKPTLRRASEDLAFPIVPPVEAIPDSDSSRPSSQIISPSGRSEANP